MTDEHTEKAREDDICRQFTAKANELMAEYDMPGKTKAMMWDLSVWLRQTLRARADEDAPTPQPRRG